MDIMTELKNMVALIATLIQQNERLEKECERLQQKLYDLHDDADAHASLLRNRIETLLES
jgi:chaperonin cofactor prefoldin